MKMMPYVISWAVLALVVLVLAAYRRWIAQSEDDYLHVEGGTAVQKQETIAHKLDAIDKWGKGLTIVVAVYALIIGVMFMYSAWVSSGTTVQS